MVRKIKNTNIYISFIVFLLAGVLILGIDFKQKIETHNNDYNTVLSQIYKINHGWQKHMNEIRDSVINLKYNNDYIGEIISSNNKILNNISNSKKRIKNQYPKTFKQFDKLILDYIEIENLTYTFLRSNARVKNSLIILKKQISNETIRGTKFQNNLIDLYLYFLSSKNNFSEIQASDEIESYYNDLIINALDENELNTLILAHISLLKNELPKLKNYYKSLQNNKISTNYTKLLKTLNMEEKNINDSIQIKFFIILSAYVLSCIFIIFLLRKTLKDNNSIIKLQKDNEKIIYYDELTNLKNKTSFYFETQNKKCIVLLIDIVDFSKINSFIGYKGGDNILKEVANILQNSHKNIYRVYSDHFAIVFEETIFESVIQKGYEIVNKLSTHHFIYKGIEIPISINIGISDKKSYLQTAETAIIKNKDSSNAISIYSSDMDEKKLVRENFNILLKVKNALETDNIKPFFQPIYNVKTNEIYKYEALVRMIDGNNVLSPFSFLEISKKSKHYSNITKIVLKKSIEFIKNTGNNVSINLSFQDIADPNMTQYILFLLKENKNIASKITFEILESEQIIDFNIILKFIDILKKNKCKIAIDDFGSGYSNFTYLSKIKPDVVKIDGSLIRDIDTNANSLHIVNAILEYTSKSGIKTVAEYIENENINECVKKLGIDFGQGYYFSPPKDLL